MAKQLFAFWSDDNACHFFAMLPAGMDSEDAKALAMAATSDANKEDGRNCERSPFDGGCDDGLCVEESIKARLTPLGFEFVDPPVGFGLWEDWRQQSTLLQARLRVEKIDFTVDAKGNLTIDTPTGAIYADVCNKTWSGQGTTGSLASHIGIGNMIYIVQLRFEATALGPKVI